MHRDPNPDMLVAHGKKDRPGGTTLWPINFNKTQMPQVALHRSFCTNTYSSPHQTNTGSNESKEINLLNQPFFQGGLQDGIPFKLQPSCEVGQNNKSDMPKSARYAS